MKKRYLLLMICIILFTFSGCKSQASPLNIENANSVLIIYGVRSYAMNSSNEDIIKSLSDYLNSFEFQKTELKMDVSSMYTILFHKDDKQIAQVCVDEHGVFWLDGKTEGLEATSDTFDLQYIKDLYSGSNEIQASDTGNSTANTINKMDIEPFVWKVSDNQPFLEKIKVPEPVSNASVNWEVGIYYSDISVGNMEAYLQKLKEEGWKDLQENEIAIKIVDGISEYMLTKGDNLLQIMCNLNDREQSICNSILVRKEVGIDILELKARKNAISKEAAKNKIQEYINQAQNTDEFPFALGTVIGVLEIFIPDAFDQLELQAYAEISDLGMPKCFLIRKGVVSYIPGNLTKDCIADIDSDGKYELIDLSTEWENSINKIYLRAYEYINPIYFSSLTEILLMKYGNCFVPTTNYEELFLKKVSDTSVNLNSNSKDYGNIIIEGVYLLPSNMVDFPYEQWDTYYNQDILLGIEKVIPTGPPDIAITIDGVGINYVVKKTKWEGTKEELSLTEVYNEIVEKNQFIPTFKLSNRIDEVEARTIRIDYGGSIPDSIIVYDAMLNEDGSLRYGEKLIQREIFKIIDDSRIELALQQNMAYFLSSSLADYEKDWLRLFRVVCTWEDKECVYGFLINTGNTEKLIN